MWFKFPEGCTAISVERQNFVVEVTDKNNNNYFRAPEHFAVRIMAAGKFTAEEPPEDVGAPDDLPKSDPTRDQAIADLTAINQNLLSDVKSLREDLNAANAKIIALTSDNTHLSTELDKANATIHELNEHVEQLTEAKG